jgi:toxin FitB
MILLDSNVVSGIMRAHLEPVVAAWLQRQQIDQLFIAAPCVFEMRHGIEIMPVGTRRHDLQAGFDDVVVTLLENRIVPFDNAAAIEAAKARAIHKSSGISTSIVDSQLAGIALALGVPVATRDVADFSGLNLSLINPWDPRP